MIIKNPRANPKSKTQIAKQKEREIRPYQYVSCHKCGAAITTLYRVGEGKYICGYCSK